MFISYEPEADSILRMWWALHDQFGDEPHFELRDGEYAYTLWFMRTPSVTVATVREVIDATVPFGVGIRLADRHPDVVEGKSPPWFR